MQSSPFQLHLLNVNLKKHIRKLKYGDILFGRKVNSRRVQIYKPLKGFVLVDEVIEKEDQV